MGLSRKRIVFLSIGWLSLVILFISVFIQPLILHLAKKQLSGVFKESKVSIAAFSLKPLGLFTLSGVEIQREPLYNLKVKDIKIRYSLPLLIKGVIPKIYLGGADIKINLGQKNLSEFSQYLKLDKSKSALLPDTVDLFGIRVDLKAKDISLNGEGSLSFYLGQGLFDNVSLEAKNLDIQDLHLKNAFLKAGQLEPTGEFFIEEIKYNKAKINKLKSSVEIKGDMLIFNSLSADLLGGRLEGDLKALLDKIPEYTVTLKAVDLNLADLVRDFELTEKLQMSGKLGGYVKLSGKGADFTLLEGDLSLPEPGGTLNIKDTRFLEGMSKNTGQPLEVVVESFKNYLYNRGKGKLSLDKGNVILGVNLEGDSGRRDFHITLHGFKFWD